MLHFGFYYIGLIAAAMLIVPNIVMSGRLPEDYGYYSINESRTLRILERVGQVAIMVCLPVFSGLTLPFRNIQSYNLQTAEITEKTELAVNLHTVWLAAGFVFLILYELYWIRYAKSIRDMKAFYAPLLGIIVPGAVLPVAAFFCFSIYSGSFLFFAVTAVFGFAHIRIHLKHRKEAGLAVKSFRAMNRGRAARIAVSLAKGALLLVLAVTLLVGGVTLFMRDFNRVKGSVSSYSGVDEELYLEMNGQRHYMSVRGDDTSNPVIIWIHGGPASPDTMMMYSLSTALKDKYTFIAYNQRGCGRTYYANEKTDPENTTATFDNLIKDLDGIADYAISRFGQEKVFIVGHSFGTMVGSRYASEHPEKVAAYIGVGHMGALGSDRYAAEDALKKARELGDDTTEFEQAMAAYEQDDSVTNMLKVRSFANKYHPVEKTRAYLVDAWFSPLFGVEDLCWFSKQLDFDSFSAMNRSLFDYISETDVYDFGTDFEIPVGILSGSCDWVTPVEVARDYYNAVNAPVKRMELLDGWGHTVPMEAPEEFAKSLNNMIGALMNCIKNSDR